MIWSFCVGFDLATGLKNLTIGILLNWDQTSPTYSGSYPGAILLAFKTIKANQILPGYSLQWVWSDTECSSSAVAGNVMYDMRTTLNINALVGPACNEDASTVYSYLAPALGPTIPVVNWGATWIKDPVSPPHFSVVGTDAAMIRAVVSTVNNFLWTRVAVLCSQDGAGIFLPTGQAMVSAFTQAKVTTALYSFTATTCGVSSTDIPTALQKMKSAGYSIAVIVGDCLDYRTVLLQAQQMSMLNGYSWMLLNVPNPQYCSSSTSLCGSSDGLDNSAVTAFAGALSFIWRSSVSSQLETSLFINQVQMQNTQFNSFISSTGPPGGTAAVSKAMYKNPAGLSGVSTYQIDTSQTASRAYATFLYDAIIVAAMVINATLSQSLSLDKFYQAGSSITYTGASGTISFDQNGHRVNTDVSIINIAKPSVEVASFQSSTGTFLLQVASQANIIWPGGSSTVPSSSLPPASTSAPQQQNIRTSKSGTNIAGIVGGVVGGVGGLLLLAVLILLWQKYYGKEKIYVHDDHIVKAEPIQHVQAKVIQVEKHENNSNPGSSQNTVVPISLMPSNPAPPDVHNVPVASPNMNTMNAANTYQAPSDAQRRLIDTEMENVPVETRDALKKIEIDPNELELREVIGTGAFAEVRKARYRGSMVAVKALHELSQDSIRRFRFEVLLMKDLRHPNIILLIGASWIGNKLMMVVEYIESGSMADVLAAHRDPPLTWKDQKLSMICDVARGMTYLHHARYFNEWTNKYEDCIIHRDLKPQNLLVTPSYNVKITDFGEARAKMEDQTMTAVGTLLYIAPEVVRGDRYDEKCDVYSFAIVMLAALQLKPNIVDVFAESIHKENSESQRQNYTPMYITTRIVNEHLRPVLPDGIIYPSLKILIEQAWSPAPALRPTFYEILEYLETIVKDEVNENIFEINEFANHSSATDVLPQEMQSSLGMQNINHSLRLKKREKKYQPVKGAVSTEFLAARNKQVEGKVYENDVQRGVIAEEDEEEDLENSEAL